MEEFELEPGETITRQVRTHWIVLVFQLIPYIVLAVVPLFVPLVFSLLQNVNPAIAASFTSKLSAAGPWLIFALAIWWLCLWMSALSLFTRYWLTIWIITTTRIVDIRQYGFFSRKVSSFLLNRVQDVTTDVEGFIPTMFKFGTLDVETAGRDEKFQMYEIQDPVELRDLIMREVSALHADGQLPQTGV
jgi:uncharacterized membrane protein YdbT with pleckstrin-like domain